jgi:hypothetical protein
LVHHEKQRQELELITKNNELCTVSTTGKQQQQATTNEQQQSSNSRIVLFCKTMKMKQQEENICNKTKTMSTTVPMCKSIS